MLITIRSAKDIGILAKKRRKEKNMTQKESAEVFGAGIRFLSELEKGNPSLEIDKVKRVMLYLGINLGVRERKRKDRTSTAGNSRRVPFSLMIQAFPTLLFHSNPPLLKPSYMRHSLQNKETEPFFGGILPDGERRERMARSVHASPSSDFNLLMNYGREVVVAIEIIGGGEALSNGSI